MPDHDCGTCGVPGQWQCIRCPRRTGPVIEFTGPSLIQTAPIPECPTHGRMHPDLAAARYVCHGWDGEGCPHVVALDDMDWTPAGVTDWATDQVAVRRDVQAAADDVPLLDWARPVTRTGTILLSDEATQRLWDMLNGHGG